MQLETQKPAEPDPEPVLGWRHVVMLLGCFANVAQKPLNEPLMEVTVLSERSKRLLVAAAAEVVQDLDNSRAREKPSQLVGASVHIFSPHTPRVVEPTLIGRAPSIGSM